MAIKMATRLNKKIKTIGDTYENILTVKKYHKSKHFAEPQRRSKHA